MKKLIAFILIVILLPLAKSYEQTSSISKRLYIPQNQEKIASIKRIVESNNFVFKAQQAIPMTGSTVNLTSSYDLTVSPQTIVAFLPYFGRAYSAPYGNTDNGIKFKSEKFQYTITKRKKGGWNIRIKTLDTQNRYELYLNISTGGYASLSVNDINRQSISFNGIIDTPEEK